MDETAGQTPGRAESAGSPPRALAGAVRAVSGMTLLSRVGGLMRDVLLVHVFGGATAIGSAFMAGFAIPNTFRRLFGEGALSAAFIPEYASTEKADPAAADRFASLTVGVLMVVTGVLTAVIELVVLVALWLSPPDPERQLMLTLVMVMLPFMPFICATAILGGMLQVHGKFAASSSGPLILNGFIIAVGVWHLWHGTAGGGATAYALGIATVLSGLTQALWFAWLLRKHAKWTRAFGDAKPRVVAMMKKMVPVLVGLGALQLNTLLDQLIATLPLWWGPTLFGRAYPLDEGSNVILVAASRLYQFPLGVFGIAVATAAFPMLARSAGDAGVFGATLRRAVRLSLFIGLPASAGLVLVRHDAMQVVFKFGARGMTGADVERSAAVLGAFATGIWAYSLNHVVSRAFYAKGDTRTPMRVALGAMAVNIALNLTLIWWWREAGLSLATSIAAAAQCVALCWLCKKKLGVEPIDAAGVGGVVKLVAITAGMALAVWGVMRVVPVIEGWKGHALRLAAACVAGAVVYPVLAVVLKAPELKWLAERGGKEGTEASRHRGIKGSESGPSCGRSSAGRG